MNVNVSVSNSPRIKSTVSNQPQVITVSSSGGQTIQSLTDVDALNAQSGALLQYNGTTNTWVASNIIEQPGLTINCGNY